MGSTLNAPLAGPKERRSLVAMALFTVFLLFVPLGVFVFSGGGLESFRVDRYATTAGVVTATDVFVSGGGKAPAKFVPAVTYRYAVGGQTYVGNRISLTGPEFASLNQAQEYAAGLQAQGSVSVLYDPEHPDRSVLSRPASAHSKKLETGVFALMLTVPLAGVLWWNTLKARRLVDGV